MKLFHKGRKYLGNIAKLWGTLFAVAALISLAFLAYSTHVTGDNGWKINLTGYSFAEFSPWGCLVILIPIINIGVMFNKLNLKTKLLLNMGLCLLGTVSLYNANVATRNWICDQATGYVRAYGCSIVYGVLLLCSCLCFYFYCNQKRDSETDCEYYETTIKQEEV